MSVGEKNEKSVLRILKIIGGCANKIIIFKQMCKQGRCKDKLGGCKYNFPLNNRDSIYILNVFK